MQIEMVSDRLILVKEVCYQLLYSGMGERSHSLIKVESASTSGDVATHVVLFRITLQKWQA